MSVPSAERLIEGVRAENVRVREFRGLRLIWSDEGDMPETVLAEDAIIDP